MDNRHFTAVVVGENPDEIMKQYDLSLKVTPYVVYRISEVKKYKENTIKAYKHLSELPTIPDIIKNEYVQQVKEVEEMSDLDFYIELTQDFDVDETTGDAMCDVNPNGHYNTCRIGENLSMPLIDKNGRETFQARKSEINWDRIHLANQDVYRITWQMVHNLKTPETEEEKQIYENMKNRKEYFSIFNSEEEYVFHNTAFWGTAFVTKDKWFELGDDMSQIEWVRDFYDNFIKNLPDNALISIYECVRY